MTLHKCWESIRDRRGGYEYVNGIALMKSQEKFELAKNFGS
jgi:hypothetical protein